MPSINPLREALPGAGTSFSVDLTQEAIPKSLTAASIADGTITTTQIASHTLISANIAQFLVQLTTINLSASQLQNMHTLPVVLLNAAPAGQSYQIYKILFRMFAGSIPYIAGGPILIYYGSNFANIVNFIPAASVNTNAGTTTDTSRVAIDSTPVIADSVVTFNQTLPFLVGNGHAFVYIWYSIV